MLTIRTATADLTCSLSRRDATGVRRDVGDRPRARILPECSCGTGWVALSMKTETVCHWLCPIASGKILTQS